MLGHEVLVSRMPHGIRPVRADPPTRGLAGVDPPSCQPRGRPVPRTRAIGGGSGTLDVMLLGLRNGRAILVLGLLTSGGCKVDPGSTMGFHEHCSDLQEDLTCRANHPARPFCSLCEDEKQGCVPARPALICQPAGSTTGAEEGDE